MKKLYIALALVVVAGGLWRFYPRTAGMYCNAFRFVYEQDCTRPAIDSIACSGLRGAYDDSIKDRANDEDACKANEKRLSDIEADIQNAAFKKQLDDLKGR